MRRIFASACAFLFLGAAIGAPAMSVTAPAASATPALADAAPALLAQAAPAAPAADAAPAAATHPNPAANASAFAVHIDDQANLLSTEDEAKLTADTEQVKLPDVVRDVYYVTFASNDDFFNDTMRFYAAGRGLQDATGEYYKDGTLFIAVGMDPRRMGVFAGQDVADALHFLDPNGENGQDMDRINGVNQSMKPLLADEKWTEGMLRGVQAAADTDLRIKNDSDEGSGWMVGGIFAAVAGFIAVIFAAIFRGSRKQKIAQARRDWDYIIAHHGDVAGRLDQINVRAHSLTSPLANDALRAQWDDIHEKFLAAHDAMGQLGELSSASPDKEFLKRSDKLADARQTVEEVINAESNIEDLARMEHGDAAVRRAELTSLHKDILKAQAKAKGAAAAQLEEIDSRVLSLREDLNRADFMGDFADILGDYRAVIEVVQEQLYEDSKIKQRDHDAATLGSADWRPGVGYYYIPFSTVDHWHDSDVSYHQSQQASSSGSSSSGYSSGGFSGSGGSSSF